MPGGEAPHSFEFVAAPTDLAPYLNSLYIWRLGDEQLDDVLPAYSGQMVVFAKGVTFKGAVKVVNVDGERS